MSPFSCQLKMPLSKPFALGFEINFKKPHLKASHNYVTYYKMCSDFFFIKMNNIFYFKSVVNWDGC